MITSNTMISQALSLWGKGAITLPKAWRERFETKHFIAKENERGNLEIIPIVDMEYWEDDKGNFGLRFPQGIEAGELLKLLNEAEKRIDRKKDG